MRNNYIVDYNKALKNRDLLDDFLNNKIDFLESSDYLESTKQNYWGLFNQFVHDFEKMYNKDLAMFNEEDVKSIIKSKLTTSASSLYVLKSLINGYEEWALKIGLNPTYNPCNGWDLRDIAIINVTSLREKYVSLDELFELWEEVKHLETIDYQIFATVLLARVGLKGDKWSEIRYLKMQDIDLDNYIINATDRNENNLENVKVVKQINIDDRILEILVGANNQTSNIRKKFDKTREKDYVNLEYIIRSTETEIVSNPLIRTSIVTFFKETGTKYIPAKNLFLNAEIDELINIKNSSEIQKLTTSDFREVVKEFEGKDSSNIAFKLKEYYQFITGDEDILNLNIKYDKEGNRIFPPGFKDYPRDRRRKKRNDEN